LTNSGNLPEKKKKRDGFIEMYGCGELMKSNVESPLP